MQLIKFPSGILKSKQGLENDSNQVHYLMRYAGYNGNSILATEIINTRVLTENTMSKNRDSQRDDGKWEVKQNDAGKASGVHDTQKDVSMEIMD